MRLKPADIIITMDKKSIFSKAILYTLRFFQEDKVKYQHVMMCVDNETCIEANWEVELNVTRERLGDFKRYKIIRHKYLTDKQRLAIVDRAKTLLGVRYSITRIGLQLLDQIFHTDYFTGLDKDPDQQICSSLVAWCYNVETGERFNGLTWEAIEPDDIDDESSRPNSDFDTILEWEKE
jgi:hypothetical protein